jgi:hypothetical protein
VINIKWFGSGMARNEISIESMNLMLKSSSLIFVAILEAVRRISLTGSLKKFMILLMSDM